MKEKHENEIWRINYKEITGTDRTEIYYITKKTYNMLGESIFHGLTFFYDMLSGTLVVRDRMLTTISQGYINHTVDRHLKKIKTNNAKGEFIKQIFLSDTKKINVYE